MSGGTPIAAEPHIDTASRPFRARYRTGVLKGLAQLGRAMAFTKARSTSAADRTP